MPFGECEEVRLDIDPEVQPDVVASITDMGEIGEFDAAYCAHALEHLYPWQVVAALEEFYRVIKPGGYAMFFVPDLEGLTPSDEVLYECPCGPITAMDLFYGLQWALQENPYMAHHTGFTSATLKKQLEEVGFRVTTQRLSNHNLAAIAQK